MLLAVPLLRALRNRYPLAWITLVAGPVNYDIMLHHPFLNEVIKYDKHLLVRSPKEFWEFLKALRRANFEMAIVPATVSLSMTSDVLARLSGAGIRVGPGRLGMIVNQTSYCYTTPVDLDWGGDPRRHQSLRNLDIVASMEIEEDDLSSVIGLTEKEKVSARSEMMAWRKKHRLFIGIHPGAGKPGNRWPADRFASIANYLAHSRDAAIVVTVGPMDAEAIAELRPLLECSPFIVADRSIREVAALVDELDLYITNDTGMMHVAGATSTRVLALFGPTDPLLWAPSGMKNKFISSRDGDITSLQVEEVRQVADVIVEQIQRDLKLK